MKRRQRASRSEFGWQLDEPVPIMLTGKVPVMRKGAPLTDPKTGRKVQFNITRRWLEEAIDLQKARRREQGYEAPMHVYHHGTGRDTQEAGYFELVDVVPYQYMGKPCHALRAKLYDIPEEIFERMRRKRLPFLSAEIHSLLRDPEIDSLAVMPDQVPHFRLQPLVPTADDVYDSVRSGHDVQLSAWVDDLSCFVGPLDVSRFCACEDESKGRVMSLKKSLQDLAAQGRAYLAAVDGALKEMDADGSDGPDDAGDAPVEPPPAVRAADDPAEGADRDESEAPAEPEIGDEGGGDSEEDETDSSQFAAQLLLENAALKGELSAFRAAAARAAKRPARAATRSDAYAALSSQLADLRALGIDDVELKLWAEQPEEQIEAYIRGARHAQQAMAPLESWTGDLPANKRIKLPGGKGKGMEKLLQELPAASHESAVQLAAEYDQLGLASEMTRTHYVVDMLIDQGALDESKYGHLRG